MAEEEGKKEDKFGFTPEGEAIGYVSLDQAQAQAMEHARENRLAPAGWSPQAKSGWAWVGVAQPV